MDEGWRTKAACAGLWPMFDDDPIPGRGRSHDKDLQRYAASICAGCEVQVECLTDAIRTENGRGAARHTIRGGLTAEQRYRQSCPPRLNLPRR